MQDNVKAEKGKKNSNHKKVPFKNDIDEIPNVDVKINQSIISLEIDALRLSLSSNNANIGLSNTPGKSANKRENENNYTQKKDKGKSKGEKSKKHEKRSDQMKDEKSKKKRSYKSSSGKTLK